MFTLPQRIDKNIEKKWQDFWQENKIFSFNLSLKKPIFVIDSPPPFTSGYLHMGHVLSYSYFDFVAHYKRMSGFNVYYPQGWDCQGFPTEVKVEKEYGKKSPLEFRNLCISWTEDCIKNMKRQMISLGFSADWNYEYRTMDKNYHRLVQLSVLKMYEKNLIYRANHPVYWCTKCKSALSKTDTEDILRSTTLYSILFGLESEGKTSTKSIEIATTRPELLHAAVAVLYNPSDPRYSEFKNKKLFAITPLFNKKVPLLADSDVDKDFGSGLVMVCTFGDKQDVIWTYRHKLNYIQAIDKDGKITNAPGFEGMSLKEAKEKIIQELEKNSKIIKKVQIQQSVKVHDRCSTPVELLNSYQWFAKIIEKKDKIIQSAKAIKWYPDFAISHLLDWANSLEWDWVISRQRIFGTPIPFWICENCNEIIPAKEAELPVYPANTTKKCPKCGSQAQGETAVFDCWVDSSISPLVISKWQEDEEFFSKTYPASLRPQGLEIIRTWAFYTIYRCVELTDKVPFSQILINGNVLAPNGKKMSKSLGNIIDPDKLIDQYGADAIRIWAALSGAMAKDRPFSYQDITFGKNFVHKLLNAGKFVQKALADFDKKNFSLDYLLEIDKFYLKKFFVLVNNVSLYWENYQFHHIIKEITNFFWHDFCDNYLEFTKYRLSSADSKSKLAAQFVLYKIYSNTILLLAPFIPHSAEELWQMFKSDKLDSVFFNSYPTPSDFKEFDFITQDILEKGKIFENILEDIRKQKASLRGQCNEIDVLISGPKEVKEVLDLFELDLKNSLKLKSITYKFSQDLKIEISTKT